MTPADEQARRYALLQAAATIVSQGYSAEGAVDRATSLLQEIERRETACAKPTTTLENPPRKGLILGRLLGLRQ